MGATRIMHHTPVHAGPKSHTSTYNTNPIAKNISQNTNTDDNRRFLYLITAPSPKPVARRSLRVPGAPYSTQIPSPSAPHQETLTGPSSPTNDPGVQPRKGSQWIPRKTNSDSVDPDSKVWYTYTLHLASLGPVAVHPRTGHTTLGISIKTSTPLTIWQTSVDTPPLSGAPLI